LKVKNTPTPSPLPAAITSISSGYWAITGIPPSGFVVGQCSPLGRFNTIGRFARFRFCGGGELVQAVAEINKTPAVSVVNTSYFMGVVQSLMLLKNSLKGWALPKSGLIG
jgi:hypothetical protein